MTDSTQDSIPLNSAQIPTDELVFAADLGGTNLRAAVIDGTGRIHERLKHPTPKDGSAEEIVKAIVEAVRECEQGSNGENRPLSRLSIVVPSPVQDNDVVMLAPNLKGLSGFRLTKALRRELPYQVLLENDANAAAVGEMWQGAARGVKTMILVTLGTGVGGGLIIDGELWRGIDGTGGEIGHITVEPMGALCGCGNRGCVEAHASATALVRMAREGRLTHPESSLRNKADLTAAAIYEAGIKGDPLACDVFQRMGTYLGIALKSLVNVLNPEMIVIGGGVADGWDLFIEPLRDGVAFAFPAPAKRAQIVRATCGDDAGLLGAAYLALTARG